MQNNLDFLSTRSGFNTALKHFKIVNKYIKNIQNGQNLADIVNLDYDQKKIEQFQFSAVLNALLVDKFKYEVKSYNMASSHNELEKICDAVKEWSKFDLVISYFHPQLGQLLINPKNLESWESLDQLKENELVVIYCGNYNNDLDKELAKKCLNSFISLLNKEKVKNSGIFKNENVSEQQSTVEKPKVKEVKPEVKAEPVRKEQLATEVKPQTDGTVQKNKLSVMYGVTVANELFHNGNVEAWKKIIASYQVKYPGIKVLVFYDGEQIQDLNTLFKWGKVKHGTNIYFRLLGHEHVDTSKLRRYLSQGASNRFEDFLKGDPTRVLTLF